MCSESYDLQFGHPHKTFRSHRLPFRKGRTVGRPEGKKKEKKTKQGRSNQGKDDLESRMMLIGLFFLLFRREDGSIERGKQFTGMALKALCHEIHQILNSGSFH